MAFTFLSAQGYEVGKSLTEPGMTDTARRVIQVAREKGVRLYLPLDCAVAREFSQGGAFLDLLKGRPLPGLDALSNK